MNVLHRELSPSARASHRSRTVHFVHLPIPRSEKRGPPHVGRPRKLVLPMGAPPLFFTLGG